MLAGLKILVRQNPYFKILDDLKFLESQDFA